MFVEKIKSNQQMGHMKKYNLWKVFVLPIESTFQVKMPLAFKFVFASVYSTEGRKFQAPVVY